MMRLFAALHGALLLALCELSAANAAVPVVDVDSSHGLIERSSACQTSGDLASPGKPGSAPGNHDVPTGMTASYGETAAGAQHLFVAGFDPKDWTGTLRKYPLASTADGMPSPGTAAEWEAGQRLTDAMSAAAKPGQALSAGRNVFTANAGAHGSISMVPFRSDSLPPAQRAAFDKSPVTGKPDGRGAERIEYLRGARELEIGKPGGIYRRRASLLGDIIHSAPVFVGDFGVMASAIGNMPKPSLKPRRHAVYVGANDGMLHAFAADTGEELFAYVPSLLLPFLNQLTAPDYRHRAFVDGGLAAADVVARGKWRTVLVAALGQGAQAVAALDVTDPEQFGSAGAVLFEFSDADDPDLGNVIGAPTIAKFRISGTGATASYRFFAVVAGGINNYRDDGPGRFNMDAASALFLLALDKSADEKWQLGKNYYKFRMPASDSTKPNGLAPPALVVDDYGAVQLAYAGDLQGNLWRLDFSGTSPWAKSLGSGLPFFTATDASGMPQAITTKPAVAFAPGDGYVVVFGTGKYLEPSDLSSQGSGAQSVYAIHDAGPGKAPLSRKQLVQRTLSEGTQAAGVAAITNPFDQAQGWFIDLPVSSSGGERVVSDPLLVADKVVVTALTSGTGHCSVPGSAQYAFNVLSGSTEMRSVVRQSLLPLPVIALDAASAQVAAKSGTGRTAVRMRHALLSPGTTQDGAVPGAPVMVGSLSSVEAAGRLAWRELPHWRELRKGRSK
ncbi:hypothetical protein E4K72_05095 [Oxalobacteraceae bacterium OM1]|nr:hypothetical protein E4K72_05095 [Oxalobacteraceae bacterium OM1]